MCLALLIFPCTIKSRSSLLALAHPGGPGKRAVKRLWCGSGGGGACVSKAENLGSANWTVHSSGLVICNAVHVCAK